MEEHLKCDSQSVTGISSKSLASHSCRCSLWDLQGAQHLHMPIP